jgi:hypothetical protein
MKFRNILGYSALLALWMGAQALGDWTLPTPGGNVTWEAYLTGAGTKQLPKQVISGPTGTPVGTSSNPISTSPISGGNALGISASGAVSFNANQVNGVAISNSNAMPNRQIIGGADLASNNPLPGQLSLGNAVLTNSNPLPINATVGGNLVNNGNPLYITPLVEPTTYNASATVSSPTNATDVLCVKGSATKTIKVKRLQISYFSGTTVYTFLSRRSSANSGGSPTTLTAVKSDPNDGAATATLTVYAGLPSLGTFVGGYRSINIPVGNPNFSEMLFHSLNEKPIYLRGVNEYLCLNMNGDTSVAATTLVSAEWSEE